MEKILKGGFHTNGISQWSVRSVQSRPRKVRVIVDVLNVHARGGGMKCWECSCIPPLCMLSVAFGEMMSALVPHANFDLVCDACGMDFGAILQKTTSNLADHVRRLRRH